METLAGWVSADVEYYMIVEEIYFTVCICHTFGKTAF